MDAAVSDVAAASPVVVPRRRSSLAREFIRLLCLSLFALTASGFIVSVFGAQSYRWQAFDVEIRVAPARQGQTRLILQPLGEVRAATHETPLALKVSLRGLSFEKLKKFLLAPRGRKDLERDFERTARRSLADFTTRQILLGALGALLAPLLFRIRRVRTWLFCGLIGGGFVAALLLVTLRTFDKQAFQNPTYTGSLREAGAIIGIARSAFVNAQALSDRLRTVAANMNTLYGRISAAPGLVPDEKETIRLLHVSDIHNNPAAVDFVRELSERFGVAAVVDTGDLSDFGTTLESPLSRGLARLRVPYVFIPGNHDSQATLRAIRANPNALILDDPNGSFVTVAGLRLLGLPDPSSARTDVGSVNTSPEELRAAGERLRAAFDREKPDIVCVHNPRMAEPLLPIAPLILCGHMHRTAIEVTDGRIVCNAGTTGGAGLRYFDRKEGVDFSAAVLTFTRPPHPRLLFIDLVVLDASLSRYSISRRTFGSGAPAAP